LELGVRSFSSFLSVYLFWFGLSCLSHEDLLVAWVIYLAEGVWGLSSGFMGHNDTSGILGCCSEELVVLLLGWEKEA
jgi:hypothetical protein